MKISYKTGMPRFPEKNQDKPVYLVRHGSRNCLKISYKTGMVGGHGLQIAEYRDAPLYIGGARFSVVL